MNYDRFEGILVDFYAKVLTHLSPRTKRAPGRVSDILFRDKRQRPTNSALLFKALGYLLIMLT
jgi:hypothetical protein